MRDIVTEYRTADGTARRVWFMAREEPGEYWRVEYEHTGEGWRETGREPVTQLDLLSSSNWPSGFIGPSFAFGERR